ncbi:PAS domain S-box protein [Arthrobacter jiangjiafuii]|uniref:histidine kinase n=1 Tax=Arthrobacter jiangjiafuii TaxID=2817475 RepID=A0A975QZL1_9MICC|nr:ATP-binding protein [Arthrobacter jiangjiafuii]MBP3042220.1 PAS domain S-box protein [Arthrobacter jiangjiafuii]QWC10010.1 PAS domain S-box protein [Arthrobacter jiangjiafuii]
MPPEPPAEEPGNSGTGVTSTPALQGYEAHFHAAPSGFLVLRPDGTILDVNLTLSRWVGRSRQGLIGTSVLELMPVGDRVVYASFAEPRLAVSGWFEEMAVTFLNAVGERLPALVSGVRSCPAESGAGDSAVDRLTVFSVPKRTLRERELAAALRAAEAAEAARAEAEQLLLEKQRALEEKDRILQENLLESRQREALLETVLNTAQVGLLVVDGEGSPMLANAHFTTHSMRIAGTESTDPTQPAALTDLFTYSAFGADRVTPLAPEQWPIRRAAAGETFSDEVMWLGTGEQQAAVSVSARPVHGGEISGSVLSYSDVTRLVHAVAAQEDFVANVSHELRTPLTSILGYLDLALDEEGLSEQVSGSLTVAQRNAERLLDLVSDLLSVASGNTKMERRTVDLAALVRSGAVSAAPRAVAAGVDLVVEVPATMPACVDPQRMEQVLDNLLSNAVKYSPDGGTVTIRLRREAGALTLEVADTGIGMSPAEQEKVFTKFFRSRRALSSAIPGAGLGLVIARNIMESHGGTLGFSSIPGEGSVFTAVLPEEGQRRGEGA